MTVDPSHLSFLALDGLRLGRSPMDAEREHLAACESCAGQLQAPTPAELVPGWLAQAGSNPVRARERSAPRWSLWWAGFGVSSLAVAAVVLLLVRPTDSLQTTPSSQGPSQVRSKGTMPAIRLHVKRGDEVWVWDGQAPVRPGDRLRLELQAAGYSHVSVASTPVPGQAPVILHQGDLREGAGLLPISFRVDAQGSREIISVILAHQPVEARWHADAGTDEVHARSHSDLAPSGSATWRQVLILRKENPP